MFETASGARGAAGRRRALAAVGALALGAGLGLAAAAPAAAAEATVSGVELRWGVNNESNNQGQFGWNFFSAGKLPSTGPAQLVQQADWRQSVGNVSIEKKQADGSYAPAAWNSWTTTAGGVPIGGPSSDNYSDHQIVIANGTGTVDVDAGTADIQWDGDFTVVFYSGFTFWYGSDPHLTVDADGTGQLTATLGGYGADMFDETKWEPLPDTEVVLANLTGVEVTADGIEVTPDYAGVTYDPPAVLPEGVSAPSPQVRTNPGWGSFPSSFVDFQLLTGQSSYWYTSGGAVDKGKSPLPIQVTYTVDTPTVPTPQVVVTPTTLDADGTTDITVTGTGFVAGADGTAPGLYVAVGPKIGDTWYTNAAPFQFAKYVRTNFTGDETASGAKLEADGSFVVHFTDVQALYTKNGTTYDAADQQFYVLTFAAQGNAYRGLDTLTPLTFVDPDGLPIQVEIPEGTVEPEPGEFTWTIDGGLAAVSLGVATSTEGGFSATGALRTITVKDTRDGAPAWSITGRVGNFTSGDGSASFGGQALGWSPTIGDNTVGAVPGAPVAPGAGALDGLKSARTLASSAAGHDLGTAAVAAGLSLLAPADTGPGSYTATLTLTALS